METGKPESTKTETVENPFINVRISDVQKAIYERMRTYAGEGGKGIDGVWNAIDPHYKYPDNAKLEGMKDEYGSTRIKKGAFRRAVSRLKRKPMNENMNFGMRGNILLTLNVLEILGLFNREELLNISRKKRGMKEFIVESHYKIGILNKKINELSKLLEMSLKRPPRFSGFKIANDWEDILFRTHEIVVNNKLDPDFYHNKIKEQIATVARNLPNNSPFILSIYNLLYDYEEYFYQDKILFNYFHKLTHTEMFYFMKAYKSISSPLYVLYFFLKMNKRFIIAINKDDKKHGVESFKIEKKRIYNESYDRFDEMENENIKKLVRDGNVGIFLQKLNNEIYKITKQIIALQDYYKYKLKDEFYDKNYAYAKECIEAFYKLYIQKTGIDENKLKLFLEENKSKNIKDIFELISLGRPIIFYVSEKLFFDIVGIKTNLASYEDLLVRVLKE
ncbi:MAG: hypothetical protein LBQ22_00275 [Bacteroidales bacterium]|jgi:hypothetical protein|nr:hypothetical protein [Bacteroidales bacterium]